MLEEQLFPKHFPYCHLEELVNICIQICCYSTALRIKTQLLICVCPEVRSIKKVCGSSHRNFPGHLSMALVENLKPWAYHLLPLNFPSHSHFLYFSFEPRYLRQFLYYGFKSSWNMQTPWELIKKTITCNFYLFFEMLFPFVCVCIFLFSIHLKNR